MRRTDGLQIDQNLTFQHREWRVQRIGWWILGGFILAALLGLFGSGVLSAAEAGARDGPLSIEYERFMRVGARTRLTIHARTGGVELHLSRAYFERFRVERFTPEPAQIEIGAETVRLTFAGGSADRFTILIDAEPLRMGRYQGTFQIAGGPAVTLTQLAYF